MPEKKKKSYTLITGPQAIGAALTSAGNAMTSFGKKVGQVAVDYAFTREIKFVDGGKAVAAKKIDAHNFNRSIDVLKQSRKLTKLGKATNVIGVGIIAGEGIYKGTKRALGPGGTQFHTGTGVPIWEDRNPSNNNTKLNY